MTYLPLDVKPPIINNRLQFHEMNKLNKNLLHGLGSKGGVRWRRFLRLLIPYFLYLEPVSLLEPNFDRLSLDGYFSE